MTTKLEELFLDQNGNIVKVECSCIGYKRDDDDGTIWRVFKPDNIWENPILVLRNRYTLRPCLGNHAIQTGPKYVIWNDDYSPYETTLIPIQYYKLVVQIMPVEACVIKDVISYLAFDLPMFPDSQRSVRGNWYIDRITPMERRVDKNKEHLYSGEDIKMIGIFTGHLMPYDTFEDFRDVTQVGQFKELVKSIVRHAENRATVSIKLKPIHSLRQVVEDGKLTWKEETNGNTRWI